MKRWTVCHPDRGFTLLEVLVALSIAAIGLAAVSRSLYQNIEVADRLDQKMIGGWVVANHLAELQISRAYLSGGATDTEVQMAARDWQIEAEYTPTGDNRIVRVDVTVYEGRKSPDSLPAASGFGFLSQPLN